MVLEPHQLLHLYQLHAYSVSRLSCIQARASRGECVLTEDMFGMFVQNRKGMEMRTQHRAIQKVVLVGSVPEVNLGQSFRPVEMGNYCLSVHLGAILKFNPGYESFYPFTFGCEFHHLAAIFLLS